MIDAIRKILSSKGCYKNRFDCIDNVTCIDCENEQLSKLIAEHDAELLDKAADRIKSQFKDMQFHTGKAWFDFDASIDRCSEKVDKVIAELKAEEVR